MNDQQFTLPVSRVVVLAERENSAVFCAEISRALGCDVNPAENEDQAYRFLTDQPADAVLADVDVLSQPAAGFVRRVKDASAHTVILLMSEAGRVPEAVQAMKAGAWDYLIKPYNASEALLQLKRALENLTLSDENRLLKEQVRLRNGYGLLLGSSPAMQKLFRAIVKVSPSSYPVLITGESGTGKELVARTIHDGSPLRDKPFVPVDCSALVTTLFESELFGHVRGAFTGAVRDKQGLLAAAEGGTVFFDEIGELPLEVQAKLLRALQEHEIRPVGSTREVRFDARVIAATNRDLQAGVADGKFRPDLYYRLNVVALRVPPLRERKGDIPALVRHFLRRFSDGKIREISPDVLESLAEYDWPGNVRELENTIQRALAMSSGPVLHVADLPTNLQNPGRANSALAVKRSVMPLAALEKEAILRAIEQCGGDKLEAARMLGIGKTTLYRKLKEYGRQG